MKTAISFTAAGAFVVVASAAPYQHAADVHLGHPPTNAPLIASSSAMSTTTIVSLTSPTFNAVHHWDYTPAPDATPLKSDGQVEKG
jgi:hypothetical protein